MRARGVVSSAATKLQTRSRAGKMRTDRVRGNRRSIVCTSGIADSVMACSLEPETISASRVGGRRRPDKRGRTCGVQSGMFVSCDALNSVYERRPGLALLRQHAPTLGRDFVEAAASLVGFFDPGALDPSTLLEAIEQGIEGINVKRDLAAGARVDQFTQLIAVAGSRVEQ